MEKMIVFVEQNFFSLVNCTIRHWSKIRSCTKCSEREHARCYSSANSSR